MTVARRSQSAATTTMTVQLKSRHTFPRGLRAFPLRSRRRGMGDNTSGGWILGGTVANPFEPPTGSYDLLGALNSAETATGNLVMNSLPPSLGGEVITPSEQAQIDAQNAAGINQASAGNTSLAEQQIAASNADTALIASEAQGGQSLTTTLSNLFGSSTSGPSTLSYALIAAALAAAGFAIQKTNFGTKTIREILLLATITGAGYFGYEAYQNSAGSLPGLIL